MIWKDRPSKEGRANYGYVQRTLVHRTFLRGGREQVMKEHLIGHLFDTED